MGGNTLSQDGKLDGHQNMDRDAALLSAAQLGQGGARLYAWTGPWVSLGRFQSPERDLIDPAMIPWVMRPTGGKAVLHGHDITVGLALPLGQGEYRQVKVAYRRVIAPIVAALRECGLPALLGEDSRFVSTKDSSDCFAASATNDVVHESTGQKVCGCALRFTRGAVLLQASIPVSEPLIEPALIFREPHQFTPTTWEYASFPEALTHQLNK